MLKEHLVQFVFILETMPLTVHFFDPIQHSPRSLSYIYYLIPVSFVITVILFYNQQARMRNYPLFLSSYISVHQFYNVCCYTVPYVVFHLNDGDIDINMFCFSLNSIQLLLL